MFLFVKKKKKSLLTTRQPMQKENKSDTLPAQQVFTRPAVMLLGVLRY